jgi:lysophospholipase L1-like esterase
VDQVLEKIDGWMRISEPDIVLIHLGNNDLTYGAKPREYHRGTSATDSADTCCQPTGKAADRTDYPLWKSSANSTTESANWEFSAEDEHPESPIVVVDHFSGFNPKAGVDTYDGCHPSAVGEQKMASRWFAALKKVLPNP